MNKYRTDTTAPHPLWSGDVAQYQADQEWRKGIPKAGAIPEPASETEQAQETP